MGSTSFIGDWRGDKAWGVGPGNLLGQALGGSEGLSWKELGPCVQHTAVLMPPEPVARVLFFVYMMELMLLSPLEG